jgi:hypothetical protein
VTRSPALRPDRALQRRIPHDPALLSTGSAAGRPALFASFPGTMGESDFSDPCITVYGPGLHRAARRPAGGGRIGDLRFPCKRRARMPGSIDDAERPGAHGHVPGPVAFCRLEGIGAPNGKSYAARGVPPVNASRAASRPLAHDSGPIWFATPSS